MAFAFNFNQFKIVRYIYEYGAEGYSFGLLALPIPIVLCFVVDYFNQRTKREDEEEFWESKYGKKTVKRTGEMANKRNAKRKCKKQETKS